MNKSLTSRIVALVCLGLFTLQSFAGTVTGQVQNAAAGPVRNGTFSFTLTAPATVAGTATVVTSSVPCYTDGNGNVAGEPDPLLAPVLSVNLASGTLPAATYFVKIWYFDGTGNSFVSPEASISLVSIGTLNVLSPVKQPLNASGYRIGISTVSGSETIQGSVTGVPGAWGNFSQSVPLTVPAAAAPVSNTTVCTLRFNDELTPSFTCYDVGLTSSTGANIPGFPQYWYLNGGSAGTINVGSGTPQSNVCQGQGVVYPQAIVTLPPFNATQTINGGLNITGNVSVGGTLGVTGNVTEIAGQNQYKAFSINSELWLDNNKYAYSGAGIIAAATDTASTGGVIHVPPNANPTFASSWTITKPITLMVSCPNTITLATNQIIVNAGVDGVAIVSECAPYGGSGTSFQHNSVSIVYTGTSAAIQVGASGATDTHSFKLWGVQVDVSGGTGTAIGLKFTQVQKSIVGLCQFSMNVNGQIGVQTNGGTTFSGTNTWFSNYWQSGTGTNVTGAQLGGDGNQSNADVFDGENHFTLGGAATTSVGIDKKAGDTLIMTEVSVDNALNAITVESTSAVAVWGFLRVDSSTTNVANFGAGSQGSMIYVSGNKPFTDNGVAGTNSVINPTRNNFRTDVWQNQVQATFSFFDKDLTDSGNSRRVYVNGVAGRTDINSGSGAGTVNLQWDQGTGGVCFGNGATTCMSQVDSTGIFHPAVAGAIGLGTAALPWKSLNIGGAATNNTTWTPTNTAARTLTSPDGNSSTVMPFNFTTTAAATDNVTVTGMTASGHCTLTPTNTAAAAGIASVFISAKAANQITVTHTATANWTFDGLCASN